MTPSVAHLRGIADLVFAHHLTGSLHDARHAGFADEHVMRFFGQHEPAGARQRIEARFGQRRQLELAVAIREEREHEEREPVARFLVERGQDARIVVVTGAAFEQRFALLRVRRGRSSDAAGTPWPTGGGLPRR